MTYDEYKKHLEACGPLDDISKGLLSAFELGYGQGIKDGKTPVTKAISQFDEALLKQGWRQCAVGQRTTQYCGIAQQAYLDGVNSGIEAEREACAKIVEKERTRWAVPVDKYEYNEMWDKCVIAIRARSEK